MSMVPEMIGVDSALIMEVGYDQAREELWVRFRTDGSLWVYSDVGADVWEQMQEADSMGRYFSAFVKGKYVGAKMMV